MLNRDQIGWLLNVPSYAIGFLAKEGLIETLGEYEGNSSEIWAATEVILSYGVDRKRLWKIRAALRELNKRRPGSDEQSHAE
jgi:hypothetical protein